MNCSGPLISRAAKSRVEGLIASAVEEGGRIHLDGRNVHVQGYPFGNFVGPTVIEAMTTMKCYRYFLSLSAHPSFVAEFRFFVAKKYLVLYLLSFQLIHLMMPWKLSTRTSTGTVPPSLLNQEPRRGSSRTRSTPARLV